MSKSKNITIISIITIFGIGLFIMFYNVFAQQMQVSSTLNTANTTPTTSVLTPSTAQVTTPTVDASTSTSPTTSSTSTASSVPTNSTSAPSASNSKYKDGTYSTSVSYRVPGHTDSIKLSVTLVGDTITSFKDTNVSSNSESTEYQGSFDGEISGQVNNQKIDSLDLSQVGGASLTTDAFMQAIQNIQSQAQA